MVAGQVLSTPLLFIGPSISSHPWPRHPLAARPRVTNPQAKPSWSAARDHPTSAALAGETRSRYAERARGANQEQCRYRAHALIPAESNAGRRVRAGLRWNGGTPWLRADGGWGGAELAFQHFEQGFLVGWWFRWPQVPVRAAGRRDVVLVNDSQCPPVLGAFVTVTAMQGSDGVGAAELLGQLLEAGPWDEDPPAVAGFGKVPGGEGFQRFVYAAGQPGGAVDQVEAPFRASGLFDGLRRRTRRGGRVPGTPVVARAVSRPCS